MVSKSENFTPPKIVNHLFNIICPPCIWVFFPFFRHMFYNIPHKRVARHFFARRNLPFENNNNLCLTEGVTVHTMWLEEGVIIKAQQTSIYIFTKIPFVNGLIMHDSLRGGNELSFAQFSLGLSQKNKAQTQLKLLKVGLARVAS